MAPRDLLPVLSAEFYSARRTGSFCLGAFRKKIFVKKEDATVEEFLQLFGFRPEGELLVGMERERILLNGNGRASPIAPQVLSWIWSQHGEGNSFGYELSACQLEDRVGPCQLQEIRVELEKNDAVIKAAGQALGFSDFNYEVGPEDMPLDVYPDPTGRYQEIVKKLSPEVLKAACQVIGTHVHIGMPDHDSALRVYNGVIRALPELCVLGDESGGERLRLYKIMAPDFVPPPYSSWREFYEEAQQKNFAKDPRKCWHLIRLSVHGTIEFRMFGTTRDLDKVVSWADACHTLCRAYL